jgi:hypothetical protein
MIANDVSLYSAGSTGGITGLGYNAGKTATGETLGGSGSGIPYISYTKDGVSQSYDVHYDDGSSGQRDGQRLQRWHSDRSVQSFDADGNSIGASYVKERSWTEPDGTKVKTLESSEPVRDANGKIVGTKLTEARQETKGGTTKTTVKTTTNVDGKQSVDIQKTETQQPDEECDAACIEEMEVEAGGDDYGDPEYIGFNIITPEDYARLEFRIKQVGQPGPDDGPHRRARVRQRDVRPLLATLHRRPARGAHGPGRDGRGGRRRAELQPGGAAGLRPAAAGDGRSGQPEGACHTGRRQPEHRRLLRRILVATTRRRRLSIVVAALTAPLMTVCGSGRALGRRPRPRMAAAGSTAGAPIGACLVVLDAIVDTDGDGFPDVDEKALGTDPNDANSHPPVLKALDLLLAGKLPSFERHFTELVVLPTKTPDGQAIDTGLGRWDINDHDLQLLNTFGDITSMLTKNGLEDLLSLRIKPKGGPDISVLGVALANSPEGQAALYSTGTGFLDMNLMGPNGSKPITNIEGGENTINGVTHGDYIVHYSDGSRTTSWRTGAAAPTRTSTSSTSPATTRTAT